jgi:hypothetical protein
MNRDNEPTNPMTAENVEQFDVWIFDSSELVASVIPIDAPWNAKAGKLRVDRTSVTRVPRKSRTGISEGPRKAVG